MSRKYRGLNLMKNRYDNLSLEELKSFMRNVIEEIDSNDSYKGFDEKYQKHKGITTKDVRYINNRIIKLTGTTEVSYEKENNE